MDFIENMFRLDGKTALVTGGAGGIGLACAKALAMAGADVILADVDDKRLLQAGEQIRQTGRRCMTRTCDVSSLSEVEALIQTAKDFGGIDILIHSAAVTNRKQLLDMTIEEWDRILHVNLDGAYHLGRSVGKMMISQQISEERTGKMTFIVSTGAYRAGINFGAYSASKAGVVMMMKTLALELAPYGITVNAIAPTATETRFTEEYYRENPQIKERVRQNHPLGRLGKVEDYMGTALYLSSDASDFVTGTMIIVDGGKTIK